MAKLIDKPIEISKDHLLLKIDINSKISCPGQFANIKVNQGTDPLLRRPFSIFDHYDNIIELVVKVVGKGTKFIRDNIEHEIDTIAPLGKGFTICENKNVLLIGGGVGNAPLYYLAKKLRSKGNIINYIYAARSKEFIYKKDDYTVISDYFYLTTDDGTEGKKGLASDIAKEIMIKGKYDYIYACGPNSMMKSIISMIKDPHIPVEVSLENYFGCGIGLCYGCAVETSHGIKRACIDGPVFDGKLINWDAIE